MSKEFELLNTYERSDSLCSPSPQKKLQYAFEERNYNKFVEILKNGVSSKRLDINYFYEDPDNCTLLDKACRAKNTAPYVEALLKFGAEVNTVNYIYKKAPLHFAVENSDFETVTVLVESPSININIQDNLANTALHSAAKQNRIEFVQLLLKHPAVDINIQNRKGLTPLHLALTQGNTEIVKLLVNRLDIDLDESKNFSGQTCREVIKEKFPEMELPQITTLTDPSKNLFSLLYNREMKKFIPLARVNKHCLNDNDGHFTYLQYACDTGMTALVDLFINLGVDPNGYCSVNNEPPLMIAARRGYYNILYRLLKNSEVSLEPVNGKTVLHCLFDGMYSTDDINNTQEERNHIKCLEYLLNEVPPEKLDINCADSAGNTVLHYAVKLNDDNIIRRLLEAGAYVGQKNVLGEVPLNSINATVLENFLDECISTNEKQSREEDYEIIYDYTFLAPPKKVPPPDRTRLAMESARTDVYEIVSETEPLLLMSEIPELRKLLKHPVLTSYLNLKWYTIRKYFYINLTFYVAFWLALTTYILYMYGSPNSRNLAANNTESIQNANVPENGTTIWCITFLLCGVLVLRELFQFTVSPWSYIKSPENWLEICLIILSGAVLTCQTSLELQPQVAAVAILVSWMELILLIGRHPLLSTNIEMFKTVTYNFLKFLAWYSILILAFAFSFYILFKDRTGDDDIFFRDPLMSIFKSVIMLTGEFDAGSIPFGTKLSTSHLLFVLFVFLIAIVLFNLLNGLAVSDTQAIRSDAEIVGNVSRVKLISYIETMAIGDPFPCLSFCDKLSCMCCCIPIRKSSKKRRIEMFYKNINLFPHILSDEKVRILPNQQNAVLVNSSVKRQPKDECWSRHSEWRIDQDIVKATKEILCQRHLAENKTNHMNGLTQQLEEYRAKLEIVEDASKRNEKMLKEIIDILRNKL